MKSCKRAQVILAATIGIATTIAVAPVQLLGNLAGNLVDDVIGNDHAGLRIAGQISRIGLGGQIAGDVIGPLRELGLTLSIVHLLL